MAGNEGNGNVNLSVILRRIMNMAVKKTVTKAAKPAVETKEVKAEETKTAKAETAKVEVKAEEAKAAKTTAKAAEAKTIDVHSFFFVIPAAISHTTEAITAPTPACIPSRSSLMMKLSRNI